MFQEKIIQTDIYSFNTYVFHIHDMMVTTETMVKKDIQPCFLMYYVRWTLTTENDISKSDMNINKDSFGLVGESWKGISEAANVNLQYT